jgi:hypothetical protein
MLQSLAALSLILSMTPSVGTCHGLALPRDAVILNPFAPIGRYEGHWGVDIKAPAGSEVAAIGVGTVSFAGSVAGRRSVTIDHGGDIRTSYSYLSAILVATGQSVGIGARVGTAGLHNGGGAFHLSLRNGPDYLDPLTLGRCSAVPEPGLWLAAVNDGYPVGRDRNSRGHVRPSTHRTSRPGSGGL